MRFRLTRLLKVVPTVHGHIEKALIEGNRPEVVWRWVGRWNRGFQARAGVFEQRFWRTMSSHPQIIKLPTTRWVFHLPRDSSALCLPP